MYGRLQQLGNAKHYETPFKRNYSKLLNSAKKKNQFCNITYEQYLEFTKVYNCHYCLENINWVPHGKNANKYFIDRKDNNIGYIVENCVVCCSKCNERKGSIYTHEEWFGMNKYFRDKIIIDKKENKG